MAADDQAGLEHNELVRALLQGPSYTFVNGLPIAVSDEPAAASADAADSTENPAPEFDGGTRESEPPPTDPVAEHNELVAQFAALLQRDGG